MRVSFSAKDVLRMAVTDLPRCAACDLEATVSVSSPDNASVLYACSHHAEPMRRAFGAAPFIQRLLGDPVIARIRKKREEEIGDGVDS